MSKPLRWRKYMRGDGFKKNEVHQLRRDGKVLVEVCKKDSVAGFQYWYFYTLGFRPFKNTAGEGMSLGTAKAAALDWVKVHEKKEQT